MRMACRNGLSHTSILNHGCAIYRMRFSRELAAIWRKNKPTQEYGKRGTWCTFIYPRYETSTCRGLAKISSGGNANYPCPWWSYVLLLFKLGLASLSSRMNPGGACSTRHLSWEPLENAERKRIGGIIRPPLTLNRPEPYPQLCLLLTYGWLHGM